MTFAGLPGQVQVHAMVSPVSCSNQPHSPLPDPYHSMCPRPAFPGTSYVSAVLSRTHQSPLRKTQVGRD